MSLRYLMMGGSSGGSSSGAIATLTMVAGGNGTAAKSTEVGYSSSAYDNFGTMTPATFDYEGWSITIEELYYNPNIKDTRYRISYPSGISTITLTMRIGKTILTTGIMDRGYTDTAYTFVYGETYTIEILSVTVKTLN